MNTQNARILSYLKRRGEIDALTALGNFGTMRLAARVYELRAQGHEIFTEYVRTRSGARIARYRLMA